MKLIRRSQYHLRGMLDPSNILYVPGCIATLKIFLIFIIGLKEGTLRTTRVTFTKKEFRMKHLFFSLAITFASSIFLFGQTDEKEVKQIMEKYQAALKNNDSTVAGSLLADNFYFVSDCGNQNKKQRLESIRSGLVNYEPYKEEDLKIYIAGTMSSIIIKTTITNKIKGCEKYHMPDVAYFTFTKVADHWQIFRECMGRNCTR